MKTGFTTRKCPKCGGNMYLGSDYCIEGGFISWYEEETCLQCGFIRSAEIPPRAVVAATMDIVTPTMKQLVAV
jgi:predicted nucleic-acid-binding Zn-ribbon protein